MTTLHDLAVLVRGAADAFAKENDYPADLEGLCGVVSWTFVSAARRCGFRAELAEGTAYREPHFWVVASPFAKGDLSLMIDLTATQFGKERIRFVSGSSRRSYAQESQGERAFKMMSREEQREALHLDLRVRRLMEQPA